MAERLPQHVGQEADQDVGQYAVLLLMPDRSDREVAFVNAKGGFRFRELDIRFPKFFVAPVGNVGPQQIATGAEGGPIANRSDLFLGHLRVALAG